MAPKPEKAQDEGRLRPTASEVKSYLRRNPDFLAENADLLLHLAPPALHDGDRVVDLQGFQIERLQAEVARLKRHEDELIAASRTNMASQSQIHTAVLALVRARTFEHLIAIVTSEFTSLLEVDAAALCVEASCESGPKVTRTDVHVLDEGVIDGVIGEGRDILLRSNIEGEPAIFRSEAPLIASDALIRLHINASAPMGLLALGSHAEDKFHPGQGTELLAFLGRSLEHCIRAWLNLPH